MMPDTRWVPLRYRGAIRRDFQADEVYGLRLPAHPGWELAGVQLFTGSFKPVARFLGCAGSGPPRVDYMLPLPWPGHPSTQHVQLSLDNEYTISVEFFEDTTGEVLALIQRERLRRLTL